MVVWLERNPGWHGRSTVLDALDIDVADWNRVISDLVDAGEVVRTGEKRGTRYRSPAADAELVHTWLSDHPGWHSRGEVRLAIGTA